MMDLRIADRAAFKRWGQPKDVAGAVALPCMPHRNGPWLSHFSELPTLDLARFFLILPPVRTSCARDQLTS